LLLNGANEMTIEKLTNYDPAEDFSFIALLAKTAT